LKLLKNKKGGEMNERLPACGLVIFFVYCISAILLTNQEENSPQKKLIF
jgi:hypothetical protein